MRTHLTIFFSKLLLIQSISAYNPQSDSPCIAGKWEANELITSVASGSKAYLNHGPDLRNGIIIEGRPPWESICYQIHSP